MKKSEIKALISLLDDTDSRVYQAVEEKIMSLGDNVIPFLESEWENNLDPFVQNRIEELIRAVQFQGLKSRIISWKDSEEQDLLEGAWILASFLFPDLDQGELEKQIEQLKYDCWLYIKEEMTEVEKIKAINYVLFTQNRFSANTKNFHSPMNSMLNYVMESKKGNPISLSILYILIAERLELPVYGVNLPNLFVITYKTEEEQFYINVFNKGLIFTRDDIENYVAQLKIDMKPAFFEPCTSLDIVQRSLRNLIVAYEKLGDQEKKQEVVELLNSTLD